jgi:hypothetical protein
MRTERPISHGTWGRGAPLVSLAALGGGVLATFLSTGLPATLGSETNAPVLQFIEPTNNTVFSTRSERPIVLRASASNNVFRTADVLAAQSVTLAWDPSVETNLAKYSLYYGVSRGTYSTQLEVSTNSAMATVSNLLAGQTYFFVVTARDVDGLKSVPSNEVSYKVPRATNSPPVAMGVTIQAQEDQSALAGTDPEGDPLTDMLLSRPVSGTFSGTAPPLTARAMGDNGTVSESARVNITVLDLTLRISVRADGAVALIIPQGALVAGGYDAEASEDLRTWTRLGPFQPGNVAAFYFDESPVGGRERRFYRSVRTPPLQP